MVFNSKIVTTIQFRIRTHHECFLLLDGLEASVAELAGGVDELEGDLLHLPLPVRRQQGLENTWTGSDTIVINTSHTTAFNIVQSTCNLVNAAKNC